MIYTDVAAIKSQISGVAGVSVEQDASETVKYSAVTTLTSLSVVGTTPDYTTVRGVQIGTGRFITQQDLDRVQKVVVLGSTVATELFGSSNPIGQLITVGNTQIDGSWCIANKRASFPALISTIRSMRRSRLFSQNSRPHFLRG